MVKFEFQINTKEFFKITISHVNTGDKFILKRIFIVYLRVKFNWVVCISIKQPYF